MRADGTFRLFSTLAPRAAVATADLPVKTRSGIIIKAIDYTCPGQNGSVIRIIRDPSGTRTPLSASQSDKTVVLSSFPYIVPAGELIRIELDNSGGAASAYLGVTVFYEEL